MKKFLISILLSLIVGSFFGYLLFRNIDTNIEKMFSETKELTFFQAGVFLNETNAHNFADTLKSSVVIEDDGFWKVYISILKDTTNVENMKKYFETENINYYLKTVNVKENEFTKELEKYETVLVNSNKETTYDIINEKILNLYKESV